MPLLHCVDQHWAPQLALYFDPVFVNKVCHNYKISTPFAKLFSLLWNDCSSINPRKNHIDFSKFEQKPNIKEIRYAQRLYLISKQKQQKERLYDYLKQGKEEWL